MEDALKRLDLLTQEEARMGIAEVLKITNGIDDKAQALIDGVCKRMNLAPDRFLILKRLSN